MASDDDQSGIDLGLHLGVGCPKKVVEFYEFIPVKWMIFLCSSVGATDGFKIVPNTNYFWRKPHVFNLPLKLRYLAVDLGTWKYFRAISLIFTKTKMSPALCDL